ncbi:MAG: DciA family protein [Gammaproteobacteria bacterium]|nr:DciA family protein [Gammaproteobacteria bacterium]
MPAKKLENLLNPGAGGGLQKLIRTARDMDTLASALRGVLPPDAAAAVVAANLREDGELVVVSASSAWASRIRFEEPAILGAARDRGFAAVSLRVRVTQGQA